MTAEIRQQALRARRNLDATFRYSASTAITQKLIHSHEFHAAVDIACYLPMPDEVDTHEIILRSWRAHKRVFCPVMEKNNRMSLRRLHADTRLARNRFGLWEPVGGECIAPRSLDLVVTPLVAFDANNNRIGMGGGYYDRCFSFLRHRRQWRKPKLIGVAFSCQQVEEIRPNPWDIRLYRVYTETSTTT